MIFVGWAKRSVPINPQRQMGTLRFAHPTHLSFIIRDGLNPLKQAL